MEIFGITWVGINSENGKKLLLSVIFIAVVLLISAALRGLVNLILGRTDHATTQSRFWTRQGVSLLATLIIVIGVVSIWFNDPTRLATAFGLMSAGLAFALQQVITAIAGYFVILRGSTFTVGDRISMGGVRGDVLRLGFIQTTIMEMARTGDSDAPFVQPHAGGFGEVVGMRGLERGDRQDLLKLVDTVRIQVPQAEVGASPCLVFVQSLAAGIEGPQAGDAHGRGLKRIAYGTQQRLGDRRKPIHRAAAGPQEQHLDGGRNPAIVAEPLRDRGDVVRAQAERLLDVELRQLGRQVLRADEALGEGHDDTLQAVETTNLPGPDRARNPTCSGLRIGQATACSAATVSICWKDTITPTSAADQSVKCKARSPYQPLASRRRRKHEVCSQRLS